MALRLEGLINTYGGLMNEKQARVLDACFDYAHDSLGGLVRKTGGTYFRHPWNVARELADRKANPLILAAGLNHDTLEELGGTDPEALEAEGTRFRHYLEERLQHSGLDRMGYSQEIDFVIALTKAVTNNQGKDYISYLKSLFAIPDKELREAAIMIKAADMIDNMVDIGMQDRFASGSNMRGHALNLWSQAWWYAERGLRHLKEYGPHHYLQFARNLPGFCVDLARKAGAEARRLARNGLSRIPSTLYADASTWLHYPGFPGHEINKRGFKNLCFLYLFKDYLKKEGMITQDPYEYDELDNVVFFFCRLGKVTERVEEALSLRIYGLGMRHGNRNLKAELDECRWQLGHEEFGFGTLDRRTAGTQCHLIHPPDERRSSSYAPARTIEELERDYKILRPASPLKRQVRGIFHGVIDMYFRALVDKKELRGVADNLAAQYSHAKAFCEIIKKIRNDYNYELEAFI